MYYVCKEYTKEDIEYQIKYTLECKSEFCTETKGYMSKVEALEIILDLAFCSEAWNNTLNCPATSFTTSEHFGIRYHLYSPTKHDVIYNPLTKEEALVICEKILDSMVDKQLVVISKSGKGVKYIG